MTKGDRIGIAVVNVLFWPLLIAGTLIHLAVVFHAYQSSGGIAALLTLIGVCFGDLYWSYQTWGQGWLPILALINFFNFFALLVLEGMKDVGDQMISEEKYR